MKGESEEKLLKEITGGGAESIEFRTENGIRRGGKGRGTRSDRGRGGRSPNPHTVTPSVHLMHVDILNLIF